MEGVKLEMLGFLGLLLETSLVTLEKVPLCLSWVLHSSVASCLSAGGRTLGLRYMARMAMFVRYLN